MVTTVFLASVAIADETIAWWRFDSDNPWADSSGNGNDLYADAVQSVTDDYDGTVTDSQGSVYFNRTSSWAMSYYPVDLSAYDAVRLSWWMKADSNALAVPIEQSVNYRAGGGILVTTNEIGEGLGTVCIFDSPTKIPPAGVHTESLPHSTQGVWEQYSIEIWPEADNAADVIKLYKNGALLEDATAYAGRGSGG